MTASPLASAAPVTRLRVTCPTCEGKGQAEATDRLVTCDPCRGRGLALCGEPVRPGPRGTCDATAAVYAPGLGRFLCASHARGELRVYTGDPLTWPVAIFDGAVEASEARW